MTSNTAKPARRARAQSLAELPEIMAPLFSGEGVKKGLELRLRESDVVITPYGKSGTTWTQQIVHTLRTGGDMDFDDISRVVPWIETSALLGIDLNAEQLANPRAFKSHLSAKKIPKGGRYINVMRHPADVLVSMFKFQEGWFLEPGAVDINEFGQVWIKRPEGYFDHLRSWWPRRNDADVLFLAYEQMLKQAPDTITRIAKFIGVPLNDDLLELTLEHSSIDFMLKHKDRFDDALMRRASEELCGLPPGSDSAKVRAGKAGSGQLLSRQTLALIDECWHEQINKPLGFENYEAMLGALSIA